MHGEAIERDLQHDLGRPSWPAKILFRRFKSLQMAANRQRQVGNWAEVIERVAAELSEKASVD